MKPRSNRPIETDLLNPLVALPCQRCGAPARFVGLESHPQRDSADLCTYECGACGHVQVDTVPRAKHRSNGVKHAVL